MAGPGETASEGITTCRGLHKHAVAFSDAADVVYRSEIADPLPLYFLWGRTIELVLKSFLIAQGESVADMKNRFRHDLVSLFHEAQDHGIANLIGSDPVHLGIVRLLNLDYKSKRLEYRKTGGIYRLTDENMTQRLIKRLLNGVDYHLKQKGL